MYILINIYKFIPRLQLQVNKKYSDYEIYNWWDMYRYTKSNAHLIKKYQQQINVSVKFANMKML